MRNLLLLLLLIPSLTWAETTLWRISQGKNTLTLGGAVHLLGSGDYPLPDEFEQAFREANLVVFETDVAALTKPDVQTNLAKRLMYADGNTLKKKIKPATYKALVRYCRTVGFPASALQTMKPALVVLTLTVTKLNKSGISSGIGVDQFFQQKAQKQNKPVIGLESIETQMKALEALGAGQEDELILSTLKELKKTDKFTANLTQAWRLGNLPELERLGIQPMQQAFPTMSQKLLTNRNNAWLEKIGAMLNTPERELVLVGALHLAGVDGLIAQLQKRGYTIEKY